MTIIYECVLFTFIFHFAAVSSWASQSQYKNRHQQFDINITAMSAASSDDDDIGGTLLVSNMHKIGLIDDTTSKLRLLLASQSPRRREILDMIGLARRYTAEPSPLDEEELQIELAQKQYTPHDYARTLAERKAHAMSITMSPNNGEVTLIIGSDTIVDLDGHIMNKPTSEEDAFNMISRLSGNWHQVHTGVAVYAVGLNGHVPGEKLMFSFTDTARVKFATLTDHDIQSYVASKEPMDKAGAYGIQGIGGQLVQRLEGDYFTVMGLPMHRLSLELSKAINSLGI